MPPPNTLSRYAMRSILNYLAEASAITGKTDFPGQEGTATWCIRMAREQLMEAACADVSVEQAEPV